MLCTNYVGIEIYGKKNKERKIVMRPEWVDAHVKQHKFVTPPVQCTGVISISISPENEPYMGGSDATISVNYTCSVCGIFSFQPKGFPDKYDLSEWVNLLMGKVDVLDYEDGPAREMRLRDERNRNVQQVMVEQSIDSRKAFDIVLRREMDAAVKAQRASKKAAPPKNQTEGWLDVIKGSSRG